MGRRDSKRRKITSFCFCFQSHVESCSVLLNGPRPLHERSQHGMHTLAMVNAMYQDCAFAANALIDTYGGRIEPRTLITIVTGN